MIPSDEDTRRADPPIDRAPRATLTCLLAPLALYAVFAASYRWVCDDAFITYRYAQNLVRGLGLRFNPATNPPVEGYTDLGWVLWTAIPESLAIDPVLWSQITTMVSGAALLWLVQRVAMKSIGLQPLAAAGALAFLATAPPFILWSSGGLGTMVFALGIFALYASLFAAPDRPRLGAALASGLIVHLSRADGLVFCSPLLVSGILYGLLQKRRRLLLVSLWTLGFLVLVFLAHTCWRYAYHGDWIPNTARAKVGLTMVSIERGCRYVATNLLAMPALIGLSLAALVCRWSNPTKGAAGAAVIGTLGYSIAAGGDFMAMGRFLLPALPFFAIFAGIALDAMLRAGRHVRAALVLLALLGTSLPALFDLHVAPLAWRTAVDFRYSNQAFQSESLKWRRMKANAKRWTLLGQALAEHVAPDKSLTVGPIGAIGYYSGLVIHDLHGLVNSIVREQVPLRDGGRCTPGHERLAPPELFAPLGVDFRHAELVSRPRKSARSGVFPGAEAIELSPREGLPEGGWLVLTPF